MIDYTLANGVYPIGQHQAYRNTSDGLSYSVMLKGDKNLCEGTFVTLCPGENNESLIVPTKCSEDVVGVITKNSGFIANSGQFPASTRIKYNVFHNPIIKINTSNSTKVEERSHHRHKPENTNDAISFPGYQTVLKDNVDRDLPFIPFTERAEYYQVAISGLVVVRASSACKIGRKCDVKCGKAIKGNTFWVVKIIDDSHIMILLK